MRKELPEYMRTLPMETLLRPRDEKRVVWTDDFLFLAGVIRSFSNDMKWLNSYLDVHNEHYYLLEDRRGGLYLPIAGTPHGVSDYAVNERIKKATVRRHFTKKFLWMRRILKTCTEKNPDTTLTIGGIVISNDGALIPGAMDRLDETVQWKIGNDVFTKYCENNLFQFSAITDDAEFDAICPIDGPVKCVYATLKSPQRTWEALYGREWGMALCPKCLGYFKIWLVKMS